MELILLQSSGVGKTASLKPFGTKKKLVRVVYEWLEIECKYVGLFRQLQQRAKIFHAGGAPCAVFFYKYREGGSGRPQVVCQTSNASQEVHHKKIRLVSFGRFVANGLTSDKQAYNPEINSCRRDTK